MTAVIQFEHGGLRCAVPASQARAVDARAPEGKLADLWQGHTTSYSRALEVRSKSRGLVWIGCGEPRLCDLPKSSAVGLSPLLRRILASLPHVVGMAILDGRLTWLVDLDRFDGLSAGAGAHR